MTKEIYIRRKIRHKRQRRCKNLMTGIITILVILMLSSFTIRSWETEQNWNESNIKTMETYGNCSD